MIALVRLKLANVLYESHRASNKYSSTTNSSRYESHLESRCLTLCSLFIASPSLISTVFTMYLFIYVYICICTYTLYMPCICIRIYILYIYIFKTILLSVGFCCPCLHHTDLLTCIGHFCGIVALHRAEGCRFGEVVAQ